MGLSRADVVAAGATLVDEIGFANLALGTLAERLGVRTPSLYKHIDSLADLRHGIAALAITELDQQVRDAMRDRSGTGALAAFANAFRDYLVAHPGRYAATIGEPYTGPEDPMLHSGSRLLESMETVLHGYDIDEQDMVHAMRALRGAFHGFATLQTSNGFQWSEDTDSSFEWMIRFIDQGLTQIGSRRTDLHGPAAD
ncbi:TetR/AcrR family transcriptional regulator [Nocardia colli]|uniref:TetR/AcrR family transcriptional regulator n=1 Tax=Nocardia colli TaxID=2545717 RepID=UPI001CC78858|nr:TetR/AcrR family transcriptional regulator [Nocardia colli]